MFELRGAVGSGATVLERAGDDADAAGLLTDSDEADLLAAELVDAEESAELYRLAQARLDRLFPRTSAGRSAWRQRRARAEGRARRLARNVCADGRRSACRAALPPTGRVRSGASLPGLTAGPELAAALADLDLARLSEHDLVHVVTSTERVASWAAATQAEAITILSDRDVYDLDPPKRRRRTVPPGVDQANPSRVEAWEREAECVRATAAEIGAAMHLSRRSAEARVWNARALTRRHPASLAALRDGVLDGYRARVIVDELDPDVTGLSVRTARRVEDAVLHRAESLTAPRLRSLVRRERIRLAPSTAEAEHQRAKNERRVEFTPGEAGMGWMHAYLSAEAIAALRAALDAAADTLKAGDQAAARARAAEPGSGNTCNGGNGSTARSGAATGAGSGAATGAASGAGSGAGSGPVVRTIEQCRADALAQMAWLALDTGQIGGCPDGTRLAHPRGQRPRVQLTVPASTLLGLDQHPGELSGYGPIPATLARAIATRGDWYRIITDPVSGTVLDVGTTRYHPPADLARHVNTRDVTCRGPGCGQPAHRSDLDHTIEYPEGPTADHNLGPLCRSDHMSKHRRGWTLTQPRPGHFEWTSPAGHTHAIAPEQVGPLPDPPDESPDHSGDGAPDADPPTDGPGNAPPASWPSDGPGEDDVPPF